MIGSIYEFLPFGIAGGAAIYYGFKSGFRPWILIALFSAGMVVLANNNLSFERGLIKGAEQDVLTYVGKLALIVVYVSSVQLQLPLKPP